MTRCERPGCSQVAEVAFGFQAEPYVIWLDATDADPGARRRAGLLCRRHADAMVVPIGWSLDDRRQPVPRLFESAEPSTTPDATGPLTRVRGRRRHDKVDRESGPTLFDVEPGAATVDDTAVDDDAVDDTAGDDEVVGDEVVDIDSPAVDVPDATPWRPVFDTADDLGGLLAATSPLLSRAFRGDDRPSKHAASPVNGVPPTHGGHG